MGEGKLDVKKTIINLDKKGGREDGLKRGGGRSNATAPWRQGERNGLKV